METENNTQEKRQEEYEYEVFNSRDWKGFGVLKWVRFYRKDGTYYLMKKSTKYLGTQEKAEEYKQKKEKEYNHQICTCGHERFRHGSALSDSCQAFNCPCRKFNLDTHKNERRNKNENNA